MMEKYITLSVIAIVYALIRAKHDSYVNDGKWKRWAVVEAGFFTGVLTYLIGTNLVDYIVFPAIFAMWWSIVFDCMCGWFRARKIFYYGTGKWDQRLAKVAPASWFFFFKVIWIIILYGVWSEITLAYF